MAKKKTSKAPPPPTAKTRSCLDCLHLVATIPVLPRTGKLHYDGAIVRCLEGYIVDGKNNPKAFKNVLRNGGKGGSRREAWRTAETCPGYLSCLDDA